MAVNKKLTSLEVLGVAIKSELEAAELYRKLANKIKNPTLKEKVQFLMAEEEKHRRIFEGIFKKSFPEVELKLPATSQVPNMEKALREDLTVEEIFQIAMEAERISQNFYA
ncbi:MAG: hypothetical protein ONB05_08210, partial [candidate division KSB1 bacterium]|nr:hypothetical protein [candidate division KSB1 bacterium]